MTPSNAFRSAMDKGISRAPLRSHGADRCGEEIKDFGDHGAHILAGLVGHLQGEQIFFEKSFRVILAVQKLAYVRSCDR
jgi:hypothetical protein